jgi:hypothetical protein
LVIERGHEARAYISRTNSFTASMTAPTVARLNLQFQRNVGARRGHRHRKAKELFMVKRSLALIAAICVCLFPSQIFGQSGQPAASSEGWRVRVIPYLWGSDFKGRVGIGDRSADVDASFSDLFRELNFAFTGVFEAGRDRFITVTDVAYMNLSDERATPGPLFSSVDVAEKSFILSPEAGYRLAGSEESFVDVLGGIRYWRIKGELKFEPGILSGIELSDSRGWVDGVFALRGKHRISKSWSLGGYGDIGGGGSNLTYHIVGTASADIGDRYGVVLGYRYLNVAYNKDRFLFDTGMGGPVLGFAFKF